ncbi:hypothetical protein NW757_013707 [Fusarium falciforme]|nr:hypothetical protein NW757_013707 [Fusarium falciforme]
MQNKGGPPISRRGGSSAGPQFRPEAVALYESQVQEFLRRIVTLIHVPAAPPLRAPELLSIIYTNTGTQRRSMLRQASQSIIKKKFSPAERANFNMFDWASAKEVKDEEEVADLAGISNHTFMTFNNAYAGDITLAPTTMLHRAIITKRPREVSDEEAREQLVVAAYKRVRVRTVPWADKKGLVSVARYLYNDGTLQLRRPGQRDTMLAVLGPRPPEQVIIVLGTGSGKTLIVIVAASLAGAGTIVLILPTVALRGNMVGRLDEVGLRHYVWERESKRVALVVIVSAEAAYIDGFLDYAYRLVDR